MWDHRYRKIASDRPQNFANWKITFLNSNINELHSHFKAKTDKLITQEPISLSLVRDG
jgi:hypothetical protein